MYLHQCRRFLPHQALGIEEPELFVGNSEIRFLGKPDLAIQIDGADLVTNDLYPVRPVMFGDFGQFLVTSVLVLADDGRHLKPGDLFDYQHIQHPVRRVGFRHRIEAAAVVAPVADAHEGLYFKK